MFFFTVAACRYPGVIVSYDASSQRHYVRYDDGEEMYLDLLEEQYKLTKR